MPPKRPRNRFCLLCANALEEINFRNSEVLYRFTSSQNKILPRKKTGTCAKHQRKLAREIKRAREMGLLGYRGQ